MSKAAAADLVLDLDLDAIYTDQGRLVLSGQTGKGIGVDAALFLTAMRLACQSTDPYFSLDPDNGRLWVEEADRASSEIWKHVETDLKLAGTDWWRNIPDGVRFRSFSVKRDYPQVWSALSPKYPNFKTRLVFKPEWLRETRYGEIFYIADILLKELSSGIPIIVPQDAQARALKVDRYTSARVRAAAESLLANVDRGQTNGRGARGTRFWFDLVPRAKSRMRSMLDDDPVVAKSYQPVSPIGQQLDAQLTSLGARSVAKGTPLLRHVSAVGGSVDLSNIYPTMFIIGHDNTTNKDAGGDDPYDLAVAEEVNLRMKEFVAAYTELRELTEAFRLYVAAVALVKHDNKSCPMITQQPLLPGEKARIKMPDHHQSELTFTVASFGHKGPDGRKTSWWSNSNYYYGGVSPGGIEVYTTAAKDPTSLTSTVQDEAVGNVDQGSWKGKSGRQYVTLLFGDAPDASAPPVTSANSPPPPSPRAGSGLLDDVDEKSRGVVVVPNR